MNIKEELKKLVENALKALGYETSVVIEIPKDTTHGDFSTNVAMRLAGQLKKSPVDIAEEIVEKMIDSENVESVEVMSPGFINFRLSSSSFTQVIKEIEDKKDSFGKSDLMSGEKVMAEFTDPNPFKLLHIGHLYSNIVGESISRIMEANGAELKKANYQGDVGLHVAKCLWGWLKTNIDIDSITDSSLTEKVKFLGKWYAEGAAAYEDSEEAKQEIQELNKKVYSKNDEKVNEIYELGKQWSLEYFEDMYKSIGMKPRENGKAFDYYYMESEVADAGKKYVEENLDKVFEKSEGAVIFPGEKYGLHNRVFINSMGLPTYEAKELGLAPRKLKDFEYDKSIIITAAEIKEYFRVLLKALSIINPDLAKKTTHLTHGFVKLPDGKMSSRKGTIIEAEVLINEVEEAVKTKSEGEVESKKIALAAIKYAFLKNSLGGDIEFNKDESLSFEGNTGSYLLYTYVRCQAILEKDSKVEIAEGTLSSEHELNVLKLLSQYIDEVKSAGEKLSPHIICNYLYDLAQAYNSFYANCRVLNAENDNDKAARVALTKATAQVLKNGLNLLGIDTVEKM